MSGYAERYQAYWDAIQRRACAVCLDAADDATCGLPRGRTCALPTQLPTIVEAILDVSSDRMDDYVAAIEAAGLEVKRVRENTDYRFLSPRAQAAADRYGVTSISVLAVKPGGRPSTQG